MNVGDRVIFVGPEYKFSNKPTIGERGTITERKGYTSQAVGGYREEVVTVNFDLDKGRGSVVALSRLKEV